MFPRARDEDAAPLHRNGQVAGRAAAETAATGWTGEGKVLELTFARAPLARRRDHPPLRLATAVGRGQELADDQGRRAVAAARQVAAVAGRDDFGTDQL